VTVNDAFPALWLSVVYQVQNSKLKFDRDSARTRLAAGHDNLVMPVARTEIRKNSFAVRVVTKWNRLQDDIKLSRSADEFKRKLKTFYKRPV
jgi:hypothetical protein